MYCASFSLGRSQPSEPSRSQVLHTIDPRSDAKIWIAVAKSRDRYESEGCTWGQVFDELKAIRFGCLIIYYIVYLFINDHDQAQRDLRTGSDHGSVDTTFVTASG